VKVRTKLILGFSVIVVLLWGVGWFASTNFGNLKSQFSAVGDSVIPGTLAIKDVENNANQAYDETINFIISGDVQARDTAHIYLSRLEEIQAGYFDHIMIDTGQFQADVAMATNITDFNFSIEALINQKDDGVGQEELLARNQVSVIPALLALKQEISAQIELYTAELAAITTSFNDTYSRSQQTLILSTGLMTLLAIVGAIFITRSIVRPLHTLHKGTEMIAEGNFDYKVGTRAKDEIGQLSRAFDRMMHSLNNSMTSVDRLNKEIDERKLAEAASRASEEKFSIAFRSSPSIVSITTRKDGKFIDVNDSFTRITGYTLEEVRDSSTTRLGLWVNPEDRTKMIQILEEQGRVDGEEFSFSMKSGEMRTWLFSAEPIDINGEPCLIVMATDITERKKTEEALRFSDAAFKSIHESVIAMDNEFNITLWNETSEKMFGVKTSDAIGKPIGDFIEMIEDYPGQNEERVKLLLEQGHNAEEQLYKTPGGKVWVDVHAQAVESDGQRQGWVTLSVDISGRKRMEQQIQKQMEQLQLANDKLMELDKMKDAFLSTVSHELRTPLTSIKSFAEILLTYDEDKDTQREFLTIINDESDRLTKLINDFLDLSKIEAGRMQWETVELSLTPVVRQAINITQAIAKENSLTVNFTETPDLPNVSCDKDRLVQVVTNLLSNAIKFTPEQGKITVKTEVVTGKGKNASDTVVVRVSDSGIGIAPGDLGAVFEKFKQVGDTLTDKPKGTGLGLPISKEIVEHYDGEIWVESQPGKGSTFSFSLPAIRKTGETEITDPRDDEVEIVEVIKSKGDKKILVVDDEENIRKFLSHELKKKGYTVFEAANGKEALDMAREYHPDLITLDVQMPDISGFDVTSVLKNDSDTKDIPILILSVIEDKDRAYKLGVNDCMTKPVNNDELLDKVNQLINKNKKNILVVDDDKSLVKSLRYHLERRGYLISTARDGKQALEMVAKKRPDLILLDIVMPNVDGYEVIKTLKADLDTASIRIVLMTGIEIDGGRVKALSIGAMDYIPKSGDFNKLYETVDNILMNEVSV